MIFFFSKICYCYWFATPLILSLFFVKCNSLSPGYFGRRPGKNKNKIIRDDPTPDFILFFLLILPVSRSYGLLVLYLYARTGIILLWRRFSNNLCYIQTTNELVQTTPAVNSTPSLDYKTMCYDIFNQTHTSGQRVLYCALPLSRKHNNVMILLYLCRTYLVYTRPHVIIFQYSNRKNRSNTFEHSKN